MRRLRLFGRRSSHLYFKKRISLEEQKAQMKDRFPRGRQIAHMIYEYFQVTGAHDAVLDFSDLFSVSLHGDDIQDFDTRWDQALSSTTQVTKDNVLESGNTRLCSTSDSIVYV